MLISRRRIAMTDQRPVAAHFFLLLLLAFVWGSSFILMKRALYASDGQLLFSSWQVAAMRVFIAGLVLSPALIGGLKKISRHHLKWMLAVGVLGNTVPAFLFTAAQLRIPSSMAGMLNSLTPLFTLIVATLVFKAAYRRAQVVGLFIGLVGAMGLITLRSEAVETDVLGASLVVVATVCYAFSVNIIRNKLVGVRPTLIAAGALGMMAVPCGLWLLFSDLAVVVQMGGSDAMIGLGAMFVLGALGTAAALVIFNRVIQQTSALFASSVTYVIPVFAAFWGVFDGESLTALHLVFAAIILSGVYLVNSSRKKL